MADNHTQDPTGQEHDPSASTQMFRAFVSEGETEATQAPKVGGRTLLVIGGVVVVIAVLAAIFLL